VEILIDAPRAKVAVEAHSPSRGPEDATVTLIEYTDFQCPYCSRVQPSIDKVIEVYGDNVRHVFKHLPLAMHKQAQLAAEASLCANDQDLFWALHDWMFSNASKLSRETIEVQAEEIGLDMEVFRGCLDGKQHKQSVDADAAEAKSLGITGTPGFLVNGRVLTGAQPYEKFVEVIDQELRAAGIEPPVAEAAQEAEAEAEAEGEQADEEAKPDAE